MTQHDTDLYKKEIEKLQADLAEVLDAAEWALETLADFNTRGSGFVRDTITARDLRLWGRHLTTVETARKVYA